MQIITVAQVLKEMETGQPFRLSFVTYDRNRKSGGELKEVEAVLEQPKNDGEEETPAGERPPTPHEANLLKLHTKNPQHQKWYTRNIRLTVDGHPTSETRKVHPPLFVEFNGKKVVP